MSVEESKEKPWNFYKEEPPIDTNIERFFLTYASISPSKLREHLFTVRQCAWQRYNYPCLGLWTFLDFSICRNPIYKEILSRCKNENATVIDFGCCLGQDVRQLVSDGVSLDQIRGFDIDPFFIQQGYELFCDEKQMKEKQVFRSGDIFDEQFLETIQPADYVHVGSFIHLFDLEKQKEVCRRLTRLCKCAILGRQVGSTVPGEYSRRGVCDGSKMMRHSPESFAQMWNEVTDGVWQVESAQLEERHLMNDVQRLIFVVRKKSSETLCSSRLKQIQYISIRLFCFLSLKYHLVCL
ncbi:unnamed protein product [Adineta ricciae]|uniref:Methyltransferase domain-containing protein n=1 Tax=Adineta ricciae TaxID=249248 RepID=A0A815QK43_ADIRI|nr:unnamed protein product [Adineta ricciae]